MKEETMTGIGVWIGVLFGIWAWFFLYHIMPWKSGEFLWWYVPVIITMLVMSFMAFLLAAAAVIYVLLKLTGKKP